MDNLASDPDHDQGGDARSDQWVLRAFSTGNALHGDQARAKTAKLLDLSAGDDPVHELMHYDADGRARPGFSAVKFLGRRDGFALLGLGAEGARLVHAFSRPIASAWACASGHHVGQRLASGHNDIAVLPYLRKLSWRRLLIQKKPRHQGRFNANPEGFVAALIERGVRTQAAFMGLAAPQGIRIEVTDIRPLGGVRIDSMGGASLSLCDVTLHTNLMLKGHWCAGYLTSYGLGYHDAAFEQARAGAMRLGHREDEHVFA